MSEFNSKLLRGINHVSDTRLGVAQLKFHSAELGGPCPPSLLYIRREKKNHELYLRRRHIRNFIEVILLSQILIPSRKI